MGKLPGMISGRVLDDDTGEAIGFANVQLYSQSDSSYIIGVTTNNEGNFSLGEVPYGRYFLLVSYLGFGESWIVDLEVSPERTSLVLGDIRLSPGTAFLDEIEVKAERAPITFGLDKRIINVSQLETTRGGTVRDLLANVPSVEVDHDGKIALRGSGNVRILVNGHPSTIAGLGGEHTLDQLLASNVQSIEIMTNPSAKYDPDGTAGIINIVMKDHARKAFNLQAEVNGGTDQQRNASLTLSNKFKKFRGQLSYSYNKNTAVREGGQDERIFNADTVRQTIGWREGTRMNAAHNISGKLDFDLPGESNLSFSAFLSDRLRRTEDDIASTVLGAEEKLVETSTRISDEREDGLVEEYALFYHNRMNEGKEEISAQLIYSANDRVEKEDIDEDINYTGGGNDHLLQYSNVLKSGSQILGQLDYTKSFQNDHKLEAGWRMTLRKSDQDFGMHFYDFNTGYFLYDEDDFNDFEYQEDVSAIYGLYTGKKDKLEYHFGLRAEQAFTTAQVRKDPEKFKNDYVEFYPSGSLTYSVDPLLSLQASYSRRINRPTERQLKPFRDLSDRRQPRQGNPYLRPEFVHSLELGMIKNWQKTTLNVNIFYKDISDQMRRVVVPGEDSLNVVTWRNIGTGKNLGVEVISSLNLFDWWAVNANWSWYKNHLKGKIHLEDVDQQALEWSARVMSNWALTKSLSVQATGFYRSKGITGQGTYEPIGILDFAVKQTLFHGRGSASFRVSDVLRSQEYRSNTYVDNTALYRTYRWQTRVFWLSLSYTFRKEEMNGVNGHKPGSNVEF